ncbi:SH3 domain-containing protein 19-like isoform X3 [Coregonus clupeaformis]|uniref:SH3 domain-containing protein 19-like isoform X3 n=1 Tax=Coregonus clupeaformis TaxID=59861 RepID=UPI001BE12B25|nr:SH3 domain-containing protein 19-like isoform X3 [Coregonus clupeaformis]
MYLYSIGPERHKEHRLSQGPLSSIRAAIKRTSTRSTSLSESNPRDRRRPEITILSAEPLASNTWFPGASGGFPPPPPPTAMIWGSSIPPTIQPPPSYDEVIREKSQVQVLPPSSSSSSPRRSVSTTTIATQTDAGLEFSAAAHGHAPNQRRSVARRPPFKAKPSHTDDTTSHADDTTSHADDTTGAATVDSLIFLEDSPALHTHTHTVTHTEETRPTVFHYELLTSDPFSPLTSASGSQTDQWGQSSFVLPPHSTIVLTTPSDPPLPHNQPRPRPRTKNSLRPIRREVKVQTLVRLGQTGSEVTENQEVSHQGGKYLQELLDAFSSDDWGFPDHHSNDKVESDLRAEEEEEEEEEDMRARIQEDHGNHADSDQGDGAFLGGGRPEPRPRIQAPPKPAPPVTPKPSLAAKTSRKGLWEDGGSMAIDVNLTVDTVTTSQSTPSLPSPKPTEAPSTTPALSPVPITTPSTPVPAPRPLLPGKPPSEPQRPDPQVGQTEGAPPRPPVAPRSNGAVVPQERSTVVGQPTPALPLKPSIDLHSTNTRPSVRQKSTAVSSSRRASVPLPASGLAVPENRRPSLVSKPSVQTPIPTSPVPLTPAVAPSPVGPRPPVLPSAPAQKKTPLVSSECEPPLPPRPQGLFKMLPLRPPPIKTVNGRHPPLQAVSTSSTTSSNQPPPPQAVATPSTTSANQQAVPGPSTTPSANQPQGQRAPKKGPPLPLRPKPGHPLYKSYMPVLPSQPSGEKVQLVTAPVSGSRCVAQFDYEGQEEDGLTFSEGDVISLTEVIGQEWGRGQIHGRIGIFPLAFMEVLEEPPPSAGKRPVVEKTTKMESSGLTAEDLWFQQGALIRVTQRVDTDWTRGTLGGREGLFPTTFTHTCNTGEPLRAAQPMTGQPVARGRGQDPV